MNTGSDPSGGDPLKIPAGPGAPAPAPAPAAPMAAIRRHVLALGIAILALAVVAVVGVVATTRPATQFAAGTPEAVFQTYLAAWDAHDLDAAHATFSARVQRQIPINEYRDMASRYSYGYGDSSEQRVVLLDSQIRDDSATLRLRIDQLGGGGLFGAQSVWSREITVDLLREQGAWRLDVALAGLEPLDWYGS